MKKSEKLRNSGIYSVFTRNYSEEGTFRALERDLDRIKSLGFDILWLMPIHPIGEAGRKGADGSPYAIKDYRAIEESLGTEDDFKSLIDSCHKKGMKLIIDVVYHHTSRDSVLLSEHPEFFYRNHRGEPGNKVGDWYDIYDLDFSRPELWEYLYESLKKWVSMGVDGFRCDVAPMVPMEFWHMVVKRFEEDGHDLIWLSESIEPEFIRFLRKGNHTAHSDSEVFTAFDLLYDYDAKPYMMKYINGLIGLQEYMDKYIQQESAYPADYVKLRFLENHDNPRAKYILKDRRRLLHFTAFMAFLKGAFLFYNGQETMTDRYLSLFDREVIEWDMDEEYTELIRNLMEIKGQSFQKDGYMDITVPTDNSVVITYEYEGKEYRGIFNLGALEEEYRPEKDSHREVLLKDIHNGEFRYPLITSGEAVTEEE